jgi:hypothetical protein
MIMRELICCIVVAAGATVFSAEAFQPRGTGRSAPRFVAMTTTTSRLWDKPKKNAKRSGGGFGSQTTAKPSFPYAGEVRPGRVSPQQVVLDQQIVKPDYWETGVPKSSGSLLPWMVEIKTADEIVKMRAAGKLARQVLDLAGRAVAAGVTTDEIDRIVHTEIVSVRSHHFFSVAEPLAPPLSLSHPPNQCD